MKLTWFGHAAVQAENGSHVILIDPFLSRNPKFKGTVDEAAHGATHVVLTHGHDDHAGDAAEICKRTGATHHGLLPRTFLRRLQIAACLRDRSFHFLCTADESDRDYIATGDAVLHIYPRSKK